MKGISEKYVCGVPSYPIRNMSPTLKKFYEQNCVQHVQQGDIKSLLTRYTDIKLPAKDPESYKILHHLVDVLDMLTFDG